MTWRRPILDFIINVLIGAAILVAACALIYASPIPMLATGQSCNKDERITCPSESDPCHDVPCWRDQMELTAWGTDPERCGKGVLCVYQFHDKGGWWMSVPVPPCTVECGP